MIMNHATFYVIQVLTMEWNDANVVKFYEWNQQWDVMSCDVVVLFWTYWYINIDKAHFKIIKQLCRSWRTNAEDKYKYIDLVVRVRPTCIFPFILKYEPISAIVMNISAPMQNINVIFAERKSDTSCSLKEMMLNHIIWLYPYLPYCIVCTS